MRSASAKRRERKGETSGRVAGPPMFMKTMAVGPVREVEDWVTGGWTVAMARDEGRERHSSGKVVDRGEVWVGGEVEQWRSRGRRWVGARSDMMVY